MADLIPQTFKASEEFADFLVKESSFHDLSRSDFIRKTSWIGALIARACPQVLNADKARLAGDMEKCGKFLVILDKFYNEQV